MPKILNKQKMTWFKPNSDGVEALRCGGPELLRPDLLKKDFHPRGDLLLEEPLRFLLDPGSSITVWYFAGRLAGPPPKQNNHNKLIRIKINVERKSTEMWISQK